MEAYSTLNRSDNPARKSNNWVTKVLVSTIREVTMNGSGGIETGAASNHAHDGLPVIGVSLVVAARVD